MLDISKTQLPESTTAKETIDGYTQVSYMSTEMIFDTGLGKSVNKFGNGANNRDYKIAEDDLLNNLVNKGYNVKSKKFI